MTAAPAPADGPTATHRLLVDWTRCDAHGLCAAVLPGRVELDEWGFALVDGRPLSDDELRQARSAAQACPMLALRVERGG